LPKTCLNSPVALVTGSTSGIGKKVSIELSKNGYILAVNGTREKEKAKLVLNEIRKNEAKRIYIRADISKVKDRNKILNTLKESFGRIDLLVNNAGISPKIRDDILEEKEEEFERILAINLKGPYFLTQMIAKWMIQLKTQITDFNPKIINISSISAYTSSLSRGSYCVSKAGLSMMTKIYSDRLSGIGINVYEIRPGIILTPMTKPLKEKYDKLISQGLLPIQRWGVPNDVAKAVVAIAKNCFPYSTGEVFNIDGGFHLKRF
jgi:NAD(P)-dependent dehydrogenase (short-subunit alcohol dehydrogenase family)